MSFVDFNWGNIIFLIENKCKLVVNKGNLKVKKMEYNGN